MYAEGLRTTEELNDMEGGDPDYQAITKSIKLLKWPSEWRELFIYLLFYLFIYYEKILFLIFIFLLLLNFLNFLFLSFFM